MSHEGNRVVSVQACLPKVPLAAICQFVKILTCPMSGWGPWGPAIPRITHESAESMAYVQR